MSSDWKVVVLQLGCRRGYATVVAFSSAGRLERFFTDFYAGKVGAGVAFGKLAKGLGIRSFAKLAGRVSPQIPANKVSHFPFFALCYKVRKIFASRFGDLPRAYVWGGRTFCKIVASKLERSTRVVYCFSSAAKEVFEAVRGSNAIRILDQATPPLDFEEDLVRRVAAKYQDWVKPRVFSRGLEEYTTRQAEEWKLADIIVCPSRFCADSVLASGVEASKIRIVPFGISPSYFSAQLGRIRNSPNGTLRVLFVGNDPLRKGMMDLVLALEQIGDPAVRGVFVGSTSSLTRKAVARASRVGVVMGTVPRTEMVKIYQNADVFVLPSISDSFGAVVLEAMAAGLPVITTPNCGASEIVRDGVDGFIVPMAAPDAIAKKIKLLASNETLRIEMGRKAMERASQYTLASYRERLLDCVEAVIRS